jgi:hypothetical protein
MRNELLNTAHKNEHFETAAFTLLALGALFAIGEAFADSDALVMRPVQWNRGFVFVVDQTPRDLYCRRNKSPTRPIRDHLSAKTAAGFSLRVL